MMGAIGVGGEECDTSRARRAEQLEPLELGLVGHGSQEFLGAEPEAEAGHQLAAGALGEAEGLEIGQGVSQAQARGDLLCRALVACNREGVQGGHVIQEGDHPWLQMELVLQFVVGRPKGGCPRVGRLGVGQEAGGEQGVRGAPEAAKALA